MRSGARRVTMMTESILYLVSLVSEYDDPLRVSLAVYSTKEKAEEYKRNYEKAMCEVYGEGAYLTIESVEYDPDCLPIVDLNLQSFKVKAHYKEDPISNFIHIDSIEEGVNLHPRWFSITKKKDRLDLVVTLYAKDKNHAAFSVRYILSPYVTDAKKKDVDALHGEVSREEIRRALEVWESMF